jgi:hypothetical protein
MFALVVVFLVFGAALVVGGTLWGSIAANPPASTTGQSIGPAPLITPPAEQH